MLKPYYNWFSSKNWTVFPFQEETWQKVLQGHSGLVNAPTGSGKTYSLLIPFFSLLTAEPNTNSIQLIWISPIRALTKEISISANRLINELQLDITVGIRTGDTSAAEKQKQVRKMPNVLITTPETLHLLIARKDHESLFKNLKGVVVDEWHELMGSKRGVLTELALARFRKIAPSALQWGISATIGNLDQALTVLLGMGSANKQSLIKANINKTITVEPLLPENISNFPWAGHLGIFLMDKVIDIVNKSTSTLIFTNTRAQTEIWYQKIIEQNPDLVGYIAMHHGSIDKEIRNWVEDALQNQQLKAVVCTSSLDLGVDFSPVESIIQVGGPKGVSRFIQRAGRSGHRPGAESKIYFMPTHAMEIFEAMALQKAVAEKYVESRIPLQRCFDVLVQYLVTLAVGSGFKPDTLYIELKDTHCFNELTRIEFDWCSAFVCTGGLSLKQYPDFNKVINKNGLYIVESKRIAMRHRLSIGVIVSGDSLNVKFISGGRIGNVEEWFISKLNIGDTFWFSGRNLELVNIKGNEVLVKKSNKKNGIVPSWMGGRMPLTANMSEMLREIVYGVGQQSTKESVVLKPLLDIQTNRSFIPQKGEFLIEYFKSKEGFHLCVYPFEGRFVHEAISALLAYRIGLLVPISFSIAFNDYGFELLSDKEINPEIILENNLLSPTHLYNDLLASVNAAEMAKRKFRDIASIAGLVFSGFPGKSQKDKHLIASAQLFFSVFAEYEPDNLLYKQAFEEVTEHQLEFERLYNTLDNISKSKWIISKPNKPTPFAFPIMVDRLREKITSEKLEDRIEKMRLLIS